MRVLCLMQLLLLSGCFTLVASRQVWKRNPNAFSDTGLSETGFGADPKTISENESLKFASFRSIRPVLMQSDLSVESGPFGLKPKSSFFTQSKKSFFG